MRRREVIAAMGCWATFTVARIAQAQDGGPMPVIALLRGGRKDREFHRADSLTSVLPAALKAMGWEEGRNVRFVHRWAEDHSERLSMLARELVAERPDVLVTTGDPATKALQVATATVAIVTMSDDVIGGGLAASMARPGGNTTGVSILATELDGKRLEILHEFVPQRRRIGVLADATTSSSAEALDRTAHDLARPTRAAICLRLMRPSSGSRAMRVKASTGPTPGIEVIADAGSGPGNCAGMEE